jgi:flagella basal body P-ring formation protein FlgA
MSRSARCKTLGCFVLFMLTGLGGRAGEIRLRERVYCESGLVRLGDVAEVLDVDYAMREKLERTALAPAPTKSHSRQISISELRRILELRGVDVALLRITGARRVLVVAGEPPACPASPAIITAQRPAARADNSIVSTPPSLPRRSAINEVRQAVLEMMPAIRSHLDQWDVEVTIPRETLWQLHSDWQSVEVEPIHEPFAGKHQVVASFVTGQHVRDVEVTVSVKRCPNAVVVARYLKKGDVISEDDVVLSPIERSEANAAVVHRLQDVVGQEATQDLQPGKPITNTMVREPIIVHRRRTVMVTSRRGSVLVKAPAVALADGGRNDVIMVELLDNKDARLLARVVSPGQVEVASGTSHAVSFRH